MHLVATVYLDRDFVGLLDVPDIGRMELVSKAGSLFRMRNPNVGRYRFVRVVKISEKDAEAIAVYGKYILYSVGWNEKDDGGVEGQNFGEGDWVWNPKASR